MPRLYLFAEGQTELTFADRVLKPHLAGLDVYLHPPVLIAHARKKGILPDYEDAKAVVGPQVAELIGLEVIRSRCPHFAAWLAQLESLKPLRR